MNDTTQRDALLERARAHMHDAARAQEQGYHAAAGISRRRAVRCLQRAAGIRDWHCTSAAARRATRAN